MKKIFTLNISLLISIIFSFTAFAEGGIQPDKFIWELPHPLIPNESIMIPEEKKVHNEDIIVEITDFIVSEIDSDFDIDHFQITKIIDPDSNALTLVSLGLKVGDYTARGMGYVFSIDENGCISSMGMNGNIKYSLGVYKEEDIDIEALIEQADKKILEDAPYSQNSRFKINDFKYYKLLDYGSMDTYYYFQYDVTIDEYGHGRIYSLYYPIETVVIDWDSIDKLTFDLNNSEVTLPNGRVLKIDTLYISTTGKVMVPLVEVLNLVDNRPLLWEEETKTAYLDGEADSLSGYYLRKIERLKVDCNNNTIYSAMGINEFSYPTEVEIINSHIYVPLRILLNAYGIDDACIEWNSEEMLITVTLLNNTF